MTTWHKLELGKDGGGPRYFLAGRPVTAGTVILMQGLLNADPEAVRFEWNGRASSVPLLYARADVLQSEPWHWFRWPS